jgi:hypothetical protein
MQGIDRGLVHPSTSYKDELAKLGPTNIEATSVRQPVRRMRRDETDLSGERIAYYREIAKRAAENYTDAVFDALNGCAAKH